MNLIDSFGNPDVIWDRVKRSIVTQSYPDGGLKIMWGVFLGFFFFLNFYREWYRKGAKLVNDFLYDDGSIVTKSDFEKNIKFQHKFMFHVLK